MKIYLYMILVALASQSSGQQNGHYRCHWYPGPAKGRVVHVDGNQEPQAGDKDPECSAADSGTLKTLVNQCTGQNMHHTDLCHSNGTWDCHAFFGVCKTLIRTENTPRSPAIDPRESLAVTCKRLFPVGSSPHQSNTAVQYPSNQDCPKDANYFTLKDLSLAVLVSFITGATMLAVVIFVVWKCRNTKWESEQRNLAMLQKVQSLAALQHIITVSNGCGSRHDVESGHFANPNYAQVLASNAIIEDLMADQDKMYEEIVTMRDSSLKKKEDTTYAKVDKSKKKATAKNAVLDDIKLQDTDYDSLAEDTDMSNTVGSVTDSGYIEEVLDAENRLATPKEKPVFVIDSDDDEINN